MFELLEPLIKTSNFFKIADSVFLHEFLTVKDILMRELPYLFRCIVFFIFEAVIYFFLPFRILIPLAVRMKTSDIQVNRN